MAGSWPQTIDLETSSLQGVSILLVASCSRIWGKNCGSCVTLPYLPVCLSVCQSVYLSIYLTACLSARQNFSIVLNACPFPVNIPVHCWPTHRNRAEYYLILSRRGRRPSRLNRGILRNIEKDNCFIIQQILIVYHFHNKKNFSCMIKTPEACNK